MSPQPICLGHRSLFTECISKVFRNSPLNASLPCMPVETYVDGVVEGLKNCLEFKKKGLRDSIP